MKIAIECQSPLLQKSLELFLAKYLSVAKKSDIVIRDIPCQEDEKCFFISSDAAADLKKPFSKSQLILALEQRYNKRQKKDFSSLEKQIQQLTTEYQNNILEAVKTFYENK